MKLMKAVALIAISGVAMSASADVAEFVFDIENWGGLPEDVVDFDFDFEAIAGGQIGSINSISIELSHSFADDIRFSVTAADGTFFELLAGQGDGGDVGDGGSDLDGMGLYTFVEASGFGTWDDLGLGNVDPVPEGTYDSNSWGDGPFAAGSWNIFLRDRFGGDDGAVGSVFIDYDVVPAPGAMALLGLGGIVAGRRRR